MPAYPKDIAVLARSYNVLDYHHNLLTLAQKAWSHSKLNQFSKEQLHNYINKAILTHYKGELTLKAYLVDRFIDTDVTAAFEIKVNQSRADFVTVNGVSRSFEIKSELDNLYKLGKQTSDYEKVFDENYIVIDEKHLKTARSIIPSHYGIYILTDDQLTEYKHSDQNDRLDAWMQLKLFTKKELHSFFPIREFSVADIVYNFTGDEVNYLFKQMLKKRYAKRWKFLVEHQEQINEVDYQFFFQHNIAPSIIYAS